MFTARQATKIGGLKACISGSLTTASPLSSQRKPLTISKVWVPKVYAGLVYTTPRFTFKKSSLQLPCSLSTTLTLWLLELQHLLLQSVTRARESLALPCTILPSNNEKCLINLCDFRSGPVSLHEAGLEKANASSSNSDDTTTSQDQDTTTSTTPSSQETLKRKLPDDGFDEHKVRILSFLKLSCRRIYVFYRRKLDTLMLVSMNKCLQYLSLRLIAEPCKYISQQTKQNSIVRC